MVTRAISVEPMRANSRHNAWNSPRRVAIGCGLAVCLFWPSAMALSEEPAIAESKVDISYLVNGRRPIWMGPVIRYTVYETTRVEARFISLTGELIEIMDLGEQTPGQYTLPWDGSTDEGALFEGKFQFELYFGDDYACRFWFISKSTMNFDEPT